jgi:MFS family permease
MQITGTAGTVPQAAEPSAQSRNLLAACLAHALHDGYTDGLYAFLPVWQGQFGLSYAGLALLRALYSGTMGSLQIPGDRLLRPLSARAALALATAIAATGFLIMALPLGLSGLCIGLVVAGIGSSIQHPRGSLLVSASYGKAARGPLGVYNFSGDLGKASLPAVAACLLPFVAWRSVTGLFAVLGLAVALALLWLAPARAVALPARAEAGVAGSGHRGFALLGLIGALDTAARMGYLLFLPFLIRGCGGTSATIGLGLALLFIGGALGKATCNWLGHHLGVVGCVMATETATALLIAATLFTPLVPLLIVLPLLGIALNGTSSVLYGTVPELAPRGDTGRAFAVFYTCVIGSGGLSPILYGTVADHSSRTVALLAAAATAAVIVPLVVMLGRFAGSPAKA